MTIAFMRPRGVKLGALRVKLGDRGVKLGDVREQSALDHGVRDVEGSPPVGHGGRSGRGVGRGEGSRPAGRAGPAPRAAISQATSGEAKAGGAAAPPLWRRSFEASFAAVSRA